MLEEGKEMRPADRERQAVSFVSRLVGGRGGASFEERGGSREVFM